MSTQEISFYIFSTLAVAFSLLVVTNKNPINSAFSLIMVFFCVAADFALLHAHLLATIQILVYAGAIMVLFVFVIMLLNVDSQDMVVKKSTGFQFLAAGLCAVLFVMFTWSIHHGSVAAEKGEFTLEKVEALGGNTQVISELMFSDAALPFELTSILLLVGIVGSVSLAKRKMDLGDEK